MLSGGVEICNTAVRASHSPEPGGAVSDNVPIPVPNNPASTVGWANRPSPGAPLKNPLRVNGAVMEVDGGPRGGTVNALRLLGHEKAITRHAPHEDAGRLTPPLAEAAE